MEETGDGSGSGRKFKFKWLMTDCGAAGNGQSQACIRVNLCAVRYGNCNIDSEIASKV